MSPLEKAARAACEVDSRLHGWKPERAWVAQGVRYEELARAVLLAVRDEVIEPYDNTEHYAFVGMIDAILEGE